VAQTAKCGYFSPVFGSLPKCRKVPDNLCVHTRERLY
jgi:hypothetical protein